MANFNGILSGIKVLDFSTLLPGPLATLFLAETGAEVIKVERPGIGDEMRYKSPEIEGTNVSFALLNRGKKSIEIDLKDKKSFKKIYPILKKTDVIVEQFRPGVMKRLNLDYQSIKKINPKIIYVSISGYGQDGPKSQIAGHDLNYISTTGLLSLSMGHKENPVVPPALIADIGGGSYPTLINILLALRKRDLENKGSYIDVSMSEGLFPFMFWGLAKGFSNNGWPSNSDYYLSGGSPRYNIYKTKDEGFIAAAPIEDRFWEKFCKAIDLPKKYVSQLNEDLKVIKKIRKIISQKNKKEWQVIFDKADCCCCVVKSLQEATKDNHFKFRKIFNRHVNLSEKCVIPSIPLPISKQFLNSNLSDNYPILGENNKKILD